MTSLGHFILSQLGEEWGPAYVKKFEEVLVVKDKFIRPEKQKQILQRINLMG